MRTKELITGFFCRRMFGAGAGTVKVLSASLMVTAMLTGCSQNDDIGGDADRIAATFNAGITATRTTDGGNNWTSTDRVGIFMVSAGGSLTTVANRLANNVEHTVDAATGALSPTGGTIYYPQSGNVDFMAYYPYGTVSADYKYTIYVAGQTSETAQNALDLLYVKKTGVAKTKTVVGLTFGHVLSKVTFNVTLGDGLTSLTGSNITDVSLTRMPLTATLVMQNGTIEAGTAGGFGTLKAATPTAPALATFTAIIVPQPQTGSDIFTGRTALFTVDGETYKWDIPDEEIFAAGNHYTYPVTVRKTGVVVGSPTINRWSTHDNGAASPQTVVIQPEANSYMVAPNGTAILIPVSRANKAADPSYNLGADATGLGGVKAGNYTVELIWSDAPVGADGVTTELRAETYGGEGYVYVKPGAAGNTVVCIRDKESGQIKWSWHIWVTQTVAQSTDVVTGLTWMDRNLGAEGTTWNTEGKNGLYYQWGRKDAFPASDGTNNIQAYYTQAGGSTSTNANLTGSYTELPGMVQNPLNFAINDDSYRGSLNANDPNDSWGSVSGAKTLYDPCPAGWRVAPYSANSLNSWGSQTTGSNAEWNLADFAVSNGAIFKGVGGTSALDHFYPASGYRNSASGAFAYVGSNGSSWSGSVTGSYGYRLAFSSGTVNPIANNYRAYGFTVRCVRE